MAKVKITKEQAELEVESWLDCKGFDEDEKESFKGATEVLCQQFVKGILRLDEDKNIIQKLRFPIKETASGDLIFDELKHKPRVWVKDIHNQYRNLKADSEDLKIKACLLASVDQKAIFMERLDSMDYRVASMVAGFLLV